ncbi:MAG: bifunctional hydroxymethylpyrimidine kinase/phosphomethylpyrimidine kinase [bacterium]
MGRSGQRLRVHNPQPVALTIAGSDCGGNAGIQADLRAFHGFGVHGCTAIAALTAQNPTGVAGILPATSDFLRLQLQTIFDGYYVGAIKTGMLLNAELIEVVAEVLARHKGIPLVVDPVMVASSGARLLEDAAVEALTRRLLPLASLITPNLPEAAVLLGRPVAGGAAAGEAARELAALFRCAVLVKGGHGSFSNQASDFLCVGEGQLACLRTPVVRHPLSLHGTGCTLSAAITAALATGCSLADAVAEGKSYVYEAIRHGRTLGPQAAVLGMVNRRDRRRVLSAVIHPPPPRQRKRPHKAP